MLLCGCGKPGGKGAAAGDEPTKAAAPARVDPEQEALDRARFAAKALGGKLKGELMAALTSGTPADALEMCAGNAGTLTRGVGAQTGVRVGRSSLRLRNPDNQGPSWVTAWLTEQGERPVSGVEGFARVEETSQGKVARFLVPIGVEPPCLNCHGPAESLESDVRARLGRHYPMDAAVGYAAGDLRGAIWAEARVK